ncbi:putative plastid-lipid-associated protein 3 [Hibiscus syriacus]|uniref:Plastid-lipid-associated protein 3 n=1 Tax=Hibiscus syriacus TaxID=106335 RepID=A0A6A2WH91_HIBSY|nr:putative plastid-lipid-associated protein 3 [Hibiscus syriacus]
MNGGEKSEFGLESEPTKLPDSDPPMNEDEWEEEYIKMAIQEVRAEILELLNQLEAVNPTGAPVEATEPLDGNWNLLLNLRKAHCDLPADVDIFGQRISFLPVQQFLNPLQELAANISGTISGQPPLKIPIPGNRSSSWLLITYLDEDLWISRGDGGLLVLARQGSSLLEQ